MNLAKFAAIRVKKSLKASVLKITQSLTKEKERENSKS